MKIEVIHAAFEDTAEHMANVTADDRMGVMEALEYAYRWTQNIMDSWSHPAGVEDKNIAVEVVGELPVRNGKTFGLRSSMMGDRFYINSGSVYDCAMIGFEEVPAREEV